MEKINLNLTGETPEIILRTGQAAPIISVVPVNIKGDINAPAEYVNKRKELISSECVTVLINSEKGQILLTDGNDANRNQIQGNLVVFPLFSDLLGCGQTWGNLTTLSNLLKRNRRFFSDSTEALTIVAGLRNFTANVTKEVEKSSDTRGNRRNAFEKVVKTNLPTTFALNMPIFKNTEPVKFAVEICIEDRDNGLTCWLESIEATELKEKIIEREIKNQLPVFSDFVTIFEV